MGFEYKRIDVDTHCQEKPNTWTSRMSKSKWGDRIPQIREVDGKEMWLADGRPMSRGGLASCHGLMPDRLTLPTRWADVPSMIYTAEGRIKAMDMDGISAQVLFSNTSGPAGNAFIGKDPEFEKACTRSYNDYVTEEFYCVEPKRFIPLALLPLSTVEGAVAELEHAAEGGHRGFVMNSAPEQYGMPDLTDRYWDPLWAASQDLQMPPHFHGTGGARNQTFKPEPGATNSKFIAIITAATCGIQAQLCARFLFSGILERFPNLIFVGAESGIGWIPYVLESCDYEWERGKLYKEGLPRKPSDVFRQQCYVDFWYEQAGLQLRDYIGVDRILWESDFPHATSIFPEADKWLKWSFEGVPAEDQHKILVENPMRLYRL
jgi:predicted TIM-barrel fold metal-dependent hydrolase